MDPQKLAVKRLFGILHAVLVICGNSTVAQLTFQFEASGCHYEGESLVLVAEYNGSKSVNTLDWYYSGKVAANIIIIASGCTQFGGADAGYPSSRMSYSCDTGANIYKATISNLAEEDEGEWGVFLTLNDYSTTALKKMPLGLCKKCDVGNITCGGHNITQSAVKEGTTAGIQCDEGCVFDGTKELTCQSDGTWNPPWKNCERTSTTTTSTTTASTSNTKPTGASTAVTSTSVAPNTSVTRTTTSDTPSTASVTVAATVTSTAISASAIMTEATTIKSTIAITRTSDQDLIIMIIIVSVIGGILVLAIFLLIFLWVHWKKCFLQKGHHQNRFSSSNNTRKDRYYQRHGKGERIRAIQMKNVMNDHFFYGGKINPVNDRAMAISNFYPNEETIRSPEYTEWLPEDSYQYDNNWKQMDRL